MPELDGKVAIVTGAGRMRSIGRSTALALASMGCDVVVTGTGRDPATFPQDERAANWGDIHSVAQEIEEMGRRSLPLVVDVTQSRQVQAMVDQTLEHLGRVDILVNNAAYPIGADRVPVVDLNEGVFHKVMEIKVTDTFLCSQAVARVLVRQGQGGKIINISSVTSKYGPANTAVYSAANAAVNVFTMSLARELGPHGINVNAVCPGGARTVRMDRLTDEDWKSIEARVPMRRAGTAAEIAQLIAFLCTDAASWIQGQALNINGGLVMEH